VTTRVLAPAAAAAGLAAAAAYTYLADPYRAGFFPPCILLVGTGHFCPGCGGLRATHELLHGDFGAAMGMNPVVVLLIIPLIVAGVGVWGVRSWQGKPAPRVSTAWAVALPVVLGVFWILRNIPVLEPYLAP
jgi:hypothetical protein